MTSFPEYDSSSSSSDNGEVITLRLPQDYIDNYTNKNTNKHNGGCKYITLPDGSEMTTKQCWEMKKENEKLRKENSKLNTIIEEYNIKLEAVREELKYLEDEKESQYKSYMRVLDINRDLRKENNKILYYNVDKIMNENDMDILKKKLKAQDNRIKAQDKRIYYLESRIDFVLSCRYNDLLYERRQILMDKEVNHEDFDETDKYIDDVDPDESETYIGDEYFEDSDDELQK